MKQEKFNVTGMSCAACSSRVEKTVSNLEGAKDVNVNLLTGTMNVTYDDGVLSEEDIEKAVEKAGYGAKAEDKGQDKGKASKSEVADEAVAEGKRMKQRLFWSVGLLIPLMAVSMGPMLFGIHHTSRPLTMIFIQLIFLIPIVFLNRKYFIKGIPPLFRGGANMDSLVAVGAGAAIVYGVFAMFRIAAGYETGDMALVHKYGAEIYFESAATILTLITVGKYLEAKSKGKTTQAIESLVNLAPKTAMLVAADGQEVEVETSELKPGDIIAVRPGESIGADGVIIEGQTSVDQSAITGESIPVEKQPGDQVVSASINKAGYIKVRCEKTGEDSTINQIISLVEEASSSKAPVARLADKIAGVFVPVVMTIALATTVIWLIAGKDFEFALSMGISVLVISCPCALGLATPVAIMVGTGKGAEMGILIKSGEALELASKIDTVVMDKTGTITEGKPKVTDIKAYGMDDDSLLNIAASLEKGSEHPLADAIVKEGEARGLKTDEAKDFKAIFGRGVQGTVDGKEYIAGNLKLMEEEGIDTASIMDTYDAMAKEGKTPLIFADRDRIIGIIAVADVEKPDSKAAVAAFEKMGIDVVMMTGDNEMTADAMKKRLNIPKVIAGVLPQDKGHYVEDLRKEGHTVAMIGDGINDGPALAAADVGIAIGAGTDVAIDSASAVLMHSDLYDGVTAIKLSKAVMKNIKENLFWAFFYNIIGIPLAAGVLYPAFGIKLSPMIGALAMSLSSVCVVTNALRLRFFKSDRKSVNTTDNKEPAKAPEKKEDKIMKYELGIEGMMCQHCQKHTHDALAAMDGVTSVEVDLEGGKATVESTKPVAEKEFADVIEEAGYKLTSYKEL